MRGVAGDVMPRPPVVTLAMGLSAMLVAFVALGGFAGACSTATDLPPDSIGSVAVLVHDLTTVPGAWLRDPERITDTTGRVLSVRPEWTSTAPAIATVDSAGGIKVLASGTVWIIARIGSHADTLRLEVAPVRFTDVIVAPEATTCGVTVTDDVYCWGAVQMSEAPAGGDAFWFDAHGPVKVVHIPGIERLTAGSEHFCALVNGAATCWGSNRIGMLGLGTIDSVFHPTPTAVPGYTFTHLIDGWFFTCGLEADGDAQCWGYNGYGELGDSSYGTIRPAPVKVRGAIAFRSLAGGLQHACGVDGSGVAYCWGAGAFGFADTDACVHAVGGAVYCTVPVPVDTLLRFTTLDVGWDHACGLTPGGTIYCWGAQPVPISSGEVFASVATGSGHACAVTVVGGAWCWGENGAGQLGNGQVGGVSSTPVAVTGGHSFSVIRAGGGVTCGLTTGGRVYCWGDNFWGEVGDGSDFSVQLRSEPREVVGQQ
jgi:hypothetical protein